MSIRGRGLQSGDTATTDWNGTGTVTHVTIVRRVDNFASGSGIAFQVTPRLKNCQGHDLLDADWFEPSPNVDWTP